ncbi:amino acid ABC transporter permease [Anaeromicropila populeti]|uniref:Amino acid ABC transporter membrane protein, PAAT family (TC 3.A.1.3.-) n=1 Tax=Anaeromicropila populeti TaxID=37658 RepID=A0A1I6HMI6_9FIRM|nr:amino acid ABC transporter permease [Anaeromicropila populeti]SFR55608.1 amino acid ABC transporter membrane protein, PAAT family (TC 3.A.1.3.-) [Anaeromicropila populeti]
MSFDFHYAITCIEPILKKLPVTMKLTLWSMAIALLGGILFALMKKSNNKILANVCRLTSSFLKGVPILVFLYFFYYSMDDILHALGGTFRFEYDLRNPPKIQMAIVALSISYIPYMSDMLLSALDTIPKGQFEACYAMGFTKLQMMIRIIIPQLIVVCIPNIGNHFVNLLKATSLAYMVTIVEMMGAAKNFAVKNQRFLETYIMAAFVYWVIFIMFEQLFQLIERHSGKYLKR